LSRFEGYAAWWMDRALVLMVGRRWPVEETIAAAKGPIGWDQNQFRTCVQRHAALCGMAVLRVICAIRARLEQQATGPVLTDNGSTAQNPDRDAPAHRLAHTRARGDAPDQHPVSGVTEPAVVEGVVRRSGCGCWPVSDLHAGAVMVTMGR
jgi:hypothetical protein